MWSATWPRSIQALASDFLKSPIRVRIGSDELTVNKRVKQVIVPCEANERFHKLMVHLEEVGCAEDAKVLIFVQTKRDADSLTFELNKNEYVGRSFGDCWKWY